MVKFTEKKNYVEETSVDNLSVLACGEWWGFDKTARKSRKLQIFSFFYKNLKLKFKRTDSKTLTKMDLSNFTCSARKTVFT
jgi:hypothetical protein